MKYSDKVVEEVKELYRQGRSTREIAKQKGIGKSTIAGMTRGIERVSPVKKVEKVKAVKKVKEVRKVKRVEKVNQVKAVRLPLPVELWKAVSKAAIDQGISKTALVKQALKEYLTHKTQS